MHRRSIFFVVLVLVVLMGPLGEGKYPFSVTPVSAKGPTDVSPLCREDGICLPAPRLASDPVSVSATTDTPRLTCETAILVKRESEVSAAVFDELLGQAGYSETEGLLVPQWWRLCAATPQDIEQEISNLKAAPGVLIAEEEGYFEFAATPNDTYYSLQWGLPRIGAPVAWDVTRGTTQVMIAVVDSGFDYGHPDTPYDLWLGWDFGAGDNEPYDDVVGHGTHVMGIAAALTNNSAGVAGLCAGCSALTVKVSDSLGRIPYGATADGIAYAAYNGASLGKRTVINISIGGPFVQIAADAVTYARNLGALLVSSSGNDGPGAPSYPAALPGVVAVSSTDSSDTPALSSQYGDIGAPGEGVLSTMPRWATNPPYDFQSGTSMASPLVASAAGLVWSAHPTFTATEVAQALLSNVTVPAGWDSRYGVGRLNVARAVSPPVYSFKVYLPLVVR